MFVGQWMGGIEFSSHFLHEIEIILKSANENRSRSRKRLRHHVEHNSDILHLLVTQQLYWC